MRRIHLLFSHSILALSMGCGDKEPAEEAPAENQPPTLEMSAVQEHARFYADVPISFAGAALDAEDTADQLLLAAESDLDGSLALSLTAAADGSVAGSGTLSEGSHSLRFTATDTAGDVTEATISVDVGPANALPSCSIAAPETGEVATAGTDVTFSGLATDDDLPATDLTVTVASDTDGTLYEGSPDSDGTVQFITDALSAANHTVTLTAVDELGVECVSSVTFTVGEPPTITIESPEDEAVINEQDEVTFLATVADLEDDPATLVLVWTSDQDGELSTDSADSAGEALFRVSDLSVGAHRIQLSATDSDGMSTTASVDLVINARPTAPTLTLTPDPAYTADDLTATATGSTDPDSSGDITYAYAWYEDSVASSLSTDAVFPASGTTKGRTYRVVVTPSDGIGDGESVEAEVTVDNTAPALTGPNLSASTVQVGDTLTCTASATDADGDVPTVSYAWSNGETGDTIVVAESDNPGDTLVCTATADDGDGGVVSDTASATVDNTDPVLTGVTVSPTSGKVGDTLTCSGTATDADGGSPALSYAWSDGSTEATYTIQESDDPGDTITCTVTATDTDGGAVSDAASATVDNTDPVLTGVTVSPASGKVGDVLTCSGTATDADGGSPALSYAWPDGSTDSTYTIQESDDPGDTITCTATATDTDGGSVSDTASATVDNTDPVVDSVAIRPDPATNDDTLTCRPSTSDADGGSPTERISWSGSLAGSLGSSTSLDLSATTVQSGETVTCTVEVEDEDGGTGTGSSAIEIENRDPSVAVAMTPTSGATVVSTLECTATVADLDDDTVTASFRWTVAGSPVTASSSDALSSTLDGAFAADQEVVCTADVTDGKGGTATDSASITIDNTPPVVADVQLSQSVAYTNDALQASATITDVDDEPLTVTYDFYVDGSLRQSGASDTLDGSSTTAGFSKNQSVTVTVTADDGTDSDSGTSAITTVLNSPPDAPITQVTPADPADGDSLLCEIVFDGDDADSDGVTYTMAWTVDGSTYPSGGGSGFTGPSTTTWPDDTVSADDLASGQSWDCVATPADDEETGTTSDASVDVCDFDADGVSSELGSCDGSDCDDEDGLLSMWARSFDLDNTIDGYVELTTTENAYDITNAYTVTAWVNAASYPTNTNSHYVLLDMERFNSNSTYSDNVGMYVMLDSNLRLVTDFGDGANWNALVPATTGGLSLNTWAHVGVTRSGSTVRYYVDGVEMDSVTVSSANIDWSGSSIREDDKTRIGMDYKTNFSGSENSSVFFDGRIGDVGIWNRALTASEISLTMDGYPTGTATSDLQAFWSAASGDMTDETGTHGTGTPGSGAAFDEECVP